MSAPSTKSLFRATKRKVKKDRKQTEIGDMPEIAPERDDKRISDDFYPTAQPEAIRALLHREHDRLAGVKFIWEPAVGAGDMAREIESHGFSVIGSDVVDRGWPNTILRSYFSFPIAYARTIITNPPYDQINARDGKGAWLRHTLDLPGVRYAAFLLSWDWPAARQNGLGALLDARPFSYCYLMRWKLDFTGQGSPPQRNAWFVWDMDNPPPPGGDPGFRWLDRTDGRQGGLFDGQ